MSLLVTGGAGFIGSHIAELLINRFPIIVVDKLAYCSSRKNVPTHAKFVYGDLCDPRVARRVVQDYDVKYIVHCAADSHVDNSFSAPTQFMHNNVTATQNLLEAAVETQVDAWLQVSTDEVYGPLQSMANESSVLDPTNPYSASKAACDLLVNAYHKSYRLPTQIIRSNNVYGPRQYPEKIIPKFITRLLEGQPCVLHGSGLHQRTYVYASDLAEAVSTVLEWGPKTGEIYNVGTEHEFSNLEIAEKLTALVSPHTPIEYEQDRPFNDAKYSIDYSKLLGLGWRPKTSFDEGLLKTINWYKLRHY